ncbi:MAG TPA: putative toxin-antitoxin system toxin component, PIN family [Blastocatellia bacterium]
MPRRKERIAVVLDTNVIVAFYLTTRRDSPNAQVFRLWRDHRELQLILSPELADEYLEILSRIGVAEKRVARFAKRLERRGTTTLVNLGARTVASRDPEDNFVLATAASGKAAFLVTNDRDLLDIPASVHKKFKFEIVTPTVLLRRLKEKK